MIEIPIPHDPHLRLHHLVLDFNGALAVQGFLLPGVAEELRALAQGLEPNAIKLRSYAGHTALAV